MTTTRRGVPVAERPRMSTGYGIATEPPDPESTRWEDVRRKLVESRNYWICTTRRDGRPHAMPVWGLWLDDALYFGTDPKSQKARNLWHNPAIVVHLESGDDVVIVQGEAGWIRDADLLRRINDAYEQKYDFRPIEDESAVDEGSWVEVRPRSVQTWLETDFPSTAVRWRFDG